MPQPALSIVLPTYNRADVLPRSIASVLEQSYGDFELIVVDDGSADGTPMVVQAIDDARIKYIKLDGNRGQSAARNVGIAASKAKLIAFQDSDDVWHADKLAHQVPLLDADAGLDGAYCDLRCIPMKGEPYIVRAPELIRGARFDRRLSLYQSHSIGIQSCVVRKEALDRVGPFREEMRCFEDLELLLRLAATHRLKRIPLPLVDYFAPFGVSKNFREQCRAKTILFRCYGYRAFSENWLGWSSELLSIALLQLLCLGRTKRPKLRSGGGRSWDAVTRQH
jgi:glycosyltransferase involved in cell wall biosynthesis